MKASNSGLRPFSPAQSSRRGSTPIASFDTPLKTLYGDDNDEYKPRHQVSKLRFLNYDINTSSSNLLSIRHEHFDYLTVVNIWRGEG